MKKKYNCKKETVEIDFFEDGRKVNFDNYHNLSLSLLNKSKTIIINSLKPIDRKGSE